MSETVKILMIDDDEEDFLIIRDTIKEIPNRKYDLEWVSNYEDGLKAISRKKHDVCLVDYRLGKDNGLELIREAIRQGCEAPLILMTGQGDAEIDEKAMQAGAADYLLKGPATPPHLLERTIRYSIRHAKNLREIKLLNAGLEKRVGERTRELADSYKILEHINKKLLIEIEEKEKAKQEAHEALEKEKELSELKSRFVSMASHEFRTPLSTILSSVSLISKYNEPEGNKDKIARHVQRVKSAVSNLNGILNDLLSLGKLEEGKVESKPEAFDLVAFAEEVTQEMQAVAKERQEFIYRHSGENKEVCLDKHLLKNILINLLSNAVKYSEEGKKIYLSTGAANGQVTISVRDEGMGIPSEDQLHLFERFFRGKNVMNIEGTGLGLNIVKKYAGLMGGAIDFKSELGKGSEFIVKFTA